MPIDKPTPENASFCYLDFDLDNHRAKLARAAAFCAATDTRYGFSSQHLLRLGGAEVAHRVAECYAMDHEWGSNANTKPIVTRPPSAGNRIGKYKSYVWMDAKTIFLVLLYSQHSLLTPFYPRTHARTHAHADCQ